MLLQFLLNGLVNGAIYALIAIGYALIYNTTGIFHIAYAILYVLAPYLFYFAAELLGMGTFPSIIMAVSLVMLSSWGIELAVYRPLDYKNSSLNVVLISSIGVMIVVMNLIALLFGNATLVLTSNISDSFVFGGIIFTHTQMLQLILSSLLVIMFFIFLYRSKLGLCIQAMRDDVLLSKIFALNIYKLRTKLFLVSGGFAAVGGLLVSYDVGMDPYKGLPMLLNAVVAIIIGGTGRFSAIVLGSILLGLLQAISIWAFDSNWQEAITFLLLIIFLLFRPQGLLGEKFRLA